MRRVALLAVPLLLAACGGSGGSGGGSSTSMSVVQSPPSATAYVNQAVAKGAKTPVHAEVSGIVTTSGQQVRMSGKGDVDPKGRRGTIHVTMSLGSQQIPLDEVLDGKTVYVSSAFFQSFLPSGKKWLSVTVAKAAQAFGAEGFALTSQPGAVPPLKDARQVGTATIGGVQTTEYAAQVDAAKLSAAQKAALQSTHADFGAIDVWVGTDGYVHRVRVGTSSSAGGQKAKIVLTTTMSNFGEKIHVTIPPASETVNANNVGIPGFSS
jgi:hypothetical protein